MFKFSNKDIIDVVLVFLLITLKIFCSVSIVDFDQINVSLASTTPFTLFLASVNNAFLLFN